MNDLARRYLTGVATGKVIDIGSQDINGSYRPIFESLGWNYRGVDLVPGDNVDIVVTDIYRLNLPSDSVDLIISGQAFEHVEFFWLVWLELVRVLRPGGKIFLIAPSRGAEHRYPVDCWRFYPDGYRTLAAWGGIEVLECGTDWELKPDTPGSEWGDTVGVFQKPPGTVLGRIRRSLLGHASRLLMPRSRMPERVERP